MDDSTIETATLHDMQFLFASAKAEGWNPGLSDAPAFYFTDTDGFFVEKLDGKLIGCISAVAYNDDYGFMGFYIVLPEYRKKGYGMKLWNHALEYLGSRNIGLDGVVAQQDNYKKSGFTFHYNNLRLEGIVKGQRSDNLEPIDSVRFQDLVEYDTSIYGTNRFYFLEHWITMPHSYGFAKRTSDRLTGYGTIRKCDKGYKIGPLFADDRDIAQEIFLALADCCENGPLFLDVVQINSDALALAKEHHLNKVFETARMYRGTPPQQQLSKVFGVTTFELG